MLATRALVILLLTTVMQRETTYHVASRIAHRAVSRCIASDRIAGDVPRYLGNGDLRAPEIARARTFLRRSSGHSVTRDEAATEMARATEREREREGDNDERGKKEERKYALWSQTISMRMRIANMLKKKPVTASTQLYFTYMPVYTYLHACK